MARSLTTYTAEFRLRAKMMIADPTLLRVPQHHRPEVAAGRQPQAVRGVGEAVHPGPTPRNAAFSRPLATSHSRTVWSQLPVASVAPSGLNAKAFTIPLCPFSTARSRRLSTS